MEPSLRSSTRRGNECKLRRTDPALHETTKRFVESLTEHSKDIRISQYADIQYASKKLAYDTWYWLTPLEGGRVGYLVCLPHQPIVWIDEQFKQSYRIQMRINSSIYQKKSVFIASLNKTDGLLRLEDIRFLEGHSLQSIPFTQRWDSLMDFYTEKYKPDTLLQQGLRVELATFLPLSNAKQWVKPPTMMYAQGEHAPRRLRIQFQEDTITHQRVPLPSGHPPMFVEESVSKEHLPDDVAKAIPHEEYPDTYNLWIKGEQKGYAAVQDLELSRKLRLASKDQKELFVKIQWNDEFNMYEILSQL